MTGSLGGCYADYIETTAMDTDPRFGPGGTVCLESLRDSAGSESYDPRPNLDQSEKRIPQFVTSSVATGMYLYSLGNSFSYWLNASPSDVCGASKTYTL